MGSHHTPHRDPSPGRQADAETFVIVVFAVAAAIGFGLPALAWAFG